MTLFPETLPPADQPYPVPENWAWVKLGQIITLEYGKSLPEKQRSGNTYPVYGSNGVIGSHEKSLIHAPAIIVGRKGSIGEVNWSEQDCWPIDTTYFVKTIADVYFVFLYRLLTTLNLKSLDRATAIPGLNRNDVYKLSVPLPPLPEQRRIAAKLDALLGKLREARSLIDEARESFALRRAAILHQALSGKLTAAWRAEHPETASRSGELFGAEIEEKPYDIPETWKWVKLKDIGEIVTGTTPSKKREDFYGNDMPLFKPTDLNQGYFVYQAQDNLSHLGSQEARILPEKSILVTCIGTIGKTGFSRRKGTTNQQINSIVPYSHIIPEYVYFGVNSHVFQQCMIEHACATTIAILNKSRFGNLAFPLAPLAEQREIVRQLESLLGHEADAAGLLDMDDELDLLEQSLLSRAFRGELGTNDPAESPATG